MYVWLLIILQKRLKNVSGGYIKPAAVVEGVIVVASLEDIPCQGFNPN